MSRRDPLSISAQARALRGLTGLPLGRCRRIIVLARDEICGRKLRRRRRPAVVRQMELSDLSASLAEVHAAFDEVRRRIAEVEG